MQGLIDSLKGYKTYLLVGAAFVYGGGLYIHLWPHSAGLDVLLGGLTVASLRAGIAKGPTVPLIAALCLGAFSITSCSTVPTAQQLANAPATTAGLDVASLATQATDIFNHVQDKNIDYAWAVSAGLNAYQSFIKTAADVKSVVAMFGGDGSYAQKLANVFGSSTAPPAATIAALAKGVTTSAATAPSA